MTECEVMSCAAPPLCCIPAMPMAPPRCAAAFRAGWLALAAYMRAAALRCGLRDVVCWSAVCETVYVALCGGGGMAGRDGWLTDKPPANCLLALSYLFVFFPRGPPGPNRSLRSAAG